MKKDSRLSWGITLLFFGIRILRTPAAFFCVTARAVFRAAAPRQHSKYQT